MKNKILYFASFIIAAVTAFMLTAPEAAHDVVAYLVNLDLNTVGGAVLANAGGIAILKRGGGGQSTTQIKTAAEVNQQQTMTASQAMQYLPTPPQITDFTFSIANAHASNAETVVLWNPSTIVTGLTQGADITTSTANGPNGATYANFIKLLIDNSFTIKGWMWNVEAQSQFSNAFTVYAGNGAGLQDSKPINSYIAQIMFFYQNQPQLYIPYPQKLDQRIAWAISQNPDSTMTMAFTVLPGSQVGYGS